MGKLFDFIKNKYKNVKDFEKILDKNPNAKGNFNLYHNPAIDLEYIKDYVNFIFNKCSFDDKYRIILENTDAVLNEKIHKKSIPNFNDGIDYENILNELEEKVIKEDADRLISDFKNEVEKIKHAPNTHPFENVVAILKNNLEVLNPSKEELDVGNIIKALDVANNNLVLKHDGGNLDKVIDTVSSSMDSGAKNHMPDFSKENGISLEDLKESDNGRNSVRISFNANKDFDKFKPVLNNEIKLSFEYKNKIKALDNYIQSKSVLKNPIYGETGNKEYGFYEWFDAATKLKEELLNNLKITSDDRENKINSFKRIQELSNKLNDITKEYKDILGYIKDNFDLDKIGLPNNIYSGRPLAINKDILENYVPNLIEDFDNNNAPYGVILNGYSQLKGYCLENNITLDEFLEDPINAYFTGAQNKINVLDEKYNIPKEEMPLGKRIARTLNQEANRYNIINKLEFGFRSLEFLTQTQDRDESLNDNILLSGISSQLLPVLNHSSTALFEPGNYTSDNMKKLFAFGNDEDNLLRVSDNYKNLVGDNYDYNYNSRIKSLANTDPVKECERVLETIKDYILERNYIFKHKDGFVVDNDNKLCEEFKPEIIVASAKDYFMDYVVQNNISIQKIRNADDKKMVLNFINNPLETVYNKYRDSLSQNAINNINIKYAQEVRKYYGSIYSEFDDAFKNNNQKPNGYNRNKTIEQILEDNKGSKWERFFKTTSPEYLALKEAILAATIEQSPTYGDFRLTKFLAKKYLDYKLKNIKNENSLSETGKRRVEFCRSLLKSFEDMEKDDVSLDMSFSDHKSDMDNDEIKEMDDFQNGIKDTIIEDESKIIEENNQENEIDILEKEDL